MDRDNAKTGNLAEELAGASGTLTVRVPRAVHAALLAEAKAESVQPALPEQTRVSTARRGAGGLSVNQLPCLRCGLV
jgi:hypothetical protein